MYHLQGFFFVSCDCDTNLLIISCFSSSAPHPQLTTMENGHARNPQTLFTSFPPMWSHRTLFALTVDAGKRQFSFRQQTRANR